MTSIDNDIRPKYVNGFNDGTYFDHQKFRKAFEKLLNEERAKKGLNKLKYSESLQKGSDIRAVEQAKVGSQKSKGKPHTRPNGSKAKTAFDKKSGFWGECSAELLGPAQHQDVNNYEMKVYKAKTMLIQNEEDVAKALFVTWCNSPGHYKAMMSDINKNFSISIQMVQTDAPEIKSKQMNPIVAFLALGY